MSIVKTKNLRDAVEVVLAAAAASEGPVITEQQFLRELVGLFANTGAVGNIFATVPGLFADADALDRVHHRFRADLQALVDGSLSSADRKRIYAAADRVLMVPRTGEGGTLRYHYISASPDAAAAHALRLLLSNPQHHNDLKQCQWRECNLIEDAPQLPPVKRFFFLNERREGRPAEGNKGTGERPHRR